MFISMGGQSWLQWNTALVRAESPLQLKKKIQHNYFKYCQTSRPTKMAIGTSHSFAYSRFQARDPEKIRSEFLSLSSLSPSLCLSPSSLRYILNTEELRVAHFEEHSEGSSLPHQFLSLTKCLPVLYFTVFSASGKKLTDENFSLILFFSFFFR
jgi:hypothetical protein